MQTPKPGAASTIPQATTQPPAIGQRWAEANGIYAGPVARPDGTVIGLVLADDIAALPRMPWGEYSQDVAGARSAHDGKANTQAMAQAGCQAAVQILAIDPTAWIPSQIEAIQLHTTLGATVGSGWHWTSTQVSSDTAFIQSFEYGYSGWGDEDYDYRVRAVRGLTLHTLNASNFAAADAAAGICVAEVAA